MLTEPSLPTPPRERWPLAVALVALLAGAGLLGVALSGTFSRSAAKLPAPPAVPAIIVATPTPAAAPAATTGDATATAAPATSSAKGKTTTKSSAAPSAAQQAID